MSQQEPKSPTKPPKPRTFAEIIGGTPSPLPEESAGQMAENLGSQALDMVKGLGNIIKWPFQQMVLGGAEWVKYFGGKESAVQKAFSTEGGRVILEGIKDTGVDLIKSVADSYAEYKNPLQKSYDKPLDVVLDILTVVSLGGAAAVRAAAVARQLGVPARIVGKLARAGQAMRGFPLRGLRPMGESSVLRFLRSGGLTPEARTIVAQVPKDVRIKALSIADRREAFGPVLAGLRRNRLIAQGALQRYRAGKAAGVSPARVGVLLTAARKAHGRYRFLRDTVKTVQQLQRIPLVRNVTRFQKLLKWADLTPELLTTNKLFNEEYLKAFGIEIAGDIKKIGKASKLPLVQRVQVMNTLLGKRAIELLSEAQKHFYDRALEIVNRRTGRLLALQGITQESAAMAPLLPARQHLARRILHKGVIDGVQIDRDTQILFKQLLGAAEQNQITDDVVRAIVEQQPSLRWLFQALSPDATEAFARTTVNAAYVASPAAAASTFTALAASASPADAIIYQAALAAHDTATRAAAVVATLAVTHPTATTALAAAHAAADTAFLAARRAFGDAAARVARRVAAVTKPFEVVLDHLVPVDQLAALSQKYFGPGTYRATYMSLIHPEFQEVAPHVVPTPTREYVAGFQKLRTGVPGFIRDPLLVLPIMVAEEHRWFHLRNFLRRLLGQPWVGDVTASIRGGTYIEKAGTRLVTTQAGWAPLNESISQSMMEYGQLIKKYAQGSTNKLMQEFLDQNLTIEKLNQVNEIRERLLRGGLRVYEVPDQVGDFLARRIERAGAFGKLVFDGPADILRVTALYLNPMWYLGNLVGNMAFMFMGGVSPFSLLMGRAGRFKRIIEGAVGNEAYRRIAVGLQTTFGHAEKRMGGFLSNLPPFRNFSMLNEKIEDFSRRATFIDRITREAFKKRILRPTELMYLTDSQIAQRLKPLLERGLERGWTQSVLSIVEGSAVSQAINFTNRWLFDYSNLHPMERTVIRRLVPFWTFIKNIHRIVPVIMAERPVLSRLALEIDRASLAKAMFDMIDDDRLPHWLQGHAPVGTNPSDPNVFYFLSLRGINPLIGFGQLFSLKRMAASSAPLIKATMEYVQGREVWSMKNLANDEPMVDYGGRWYRIKLIGGKVLFQRDTPGPRSFFGFRDPLGITGFLTTFWRQFPQTNMLMTLIDRQSLDERGQPVQTPYMDASGNVNYPQTFHLSMMRLLGANVKQVDMRQLRQSERLARVRFIKNLVKMSRKAPPSLRGFLQMVISKVVRGESRMEAH